MFAMPPSSVKIAPAHNKEAVMSNEVFSHMKEERSFAPPAEFIARARIGAIHAGVFSVFSPDALTSRIQDRRSSRHGSRVVSS